MCGIIIFFGFAIICCNIEKNGNRRGTGKPDKEGFYKSADVSAQHVDGAVAYFP
jgi:hypothetical protein